MTDFPDFYIAGFNRCGTSSLHKLLSFHPDICMSDPKEVFAFVINGNYRKGAAHYDGYFKHCKDEKLKGEATPSYIYKGQIYETSVHDYLWSEDEDSIIRMARDVPNAKIIISIRNPFDNAQSNFEKAKVVGTESLSATLEQVFEAEESGMRKPQDVYRCYLYLTRYSHHLEHLLKYFPRDQILFLKFENWTRNQQDAMNEVANFLGIPGCNVSGKDVMVNEGKTVKAPWLHKIFQKFLPRKIYNPLLLRLGTARGYQKKDEETRARLLNKYYRADIKRCEELTGLNLQSWLS